MSKKRILILGAGISGLTLAYYLSKASDDLDITILEKANRPGGWIRSERTAGFFFEHGPRTFMRTKADDIIALAKDLGMEDEIIPSDKKGYGRYLWINGELKKLPIFSLPFLWGFLKEWTVMPSEDEDESVYSFASRRFNSTVADYFFDPLSIGIYAGDMHRISMKSCFPKWKNWEKEHGSMTMGYLKTPGMKGSRLISFKNGVESLVHRIVSKSNARIVLNCTVKKVDFKQDGAVVKTDQGDFEADFVFSALPCLAAGQLIEPELLKIPLRGTTVVNLGFASDVLKRRGFGYIVSSKERDDHLLGVVFNTNAFPHHNAHPEETRLTVKLRRTDITDEESIAMALEAIKKHLGITAPPDVAIVMKAEDAFPQLEVGYADKIQELLVSLEQKYPQLRLVGNYLVKGVGVNDCIATSRSAAEEFLAKLHVGV
jgi:oxygen-dependent protoporphyrinogen oxidase